MSWPTSPRRLRENAGPARNLGFSRVRWQARAPAAVTRGHASIGLVLRRHYESPALECPDWFRVTDGGVTLGPGWVAEVTATSAQC